jgi:hypothetical protein
MSLSRRDWIKSVALAALASRRAFAASPASPALIKITVYKTASCGCCKDWVAHLAKNGFSPTVHDIDDLTETKTALRVPPELASCHTAVAGRYVIEGHVPADLIKKLIADKPTTIVGLAVPGMVPGSPGMETGQKEPYDVIAFTAEGKHSVYAHR